MRLQTRCVLVLCFALAPASRASAQLVDDVSHVNALTHYRVILGRTFALDAQMTVGSVTEAVEVTAART
jgi:hypothetical protein